ncbi:MAG: cupin domain-containing protein [Pseudomonadota bacterium]
MRLNADFTQRAEVVACDDLWQRSPEMGVDRLMLDRVGGEVARVTSIVRYDTGSSFARHEHAKGEEFLALEGVFTDETGDYPVGSYVRNPPCSLHASFSEQGCRILVKLRRFADDDLRQSAIDTRDPSLCDVERGTLPLHSFAAERVHMQRLARADRRWQ